MAESQSLPKREELDDQYKWDLEDMFPSDDAWKKSFGEMNSLLEEIQAFKDKIGDSSDRLLECLKLRDRISMKTEQLYVYAHMKLHENTSNPIYQSLSDQAQGLSIQVSSATAFIVPEILSIPTDTLKKYMGSDNGIKLYTHLLNDLIRQKAHILPAEQEQLLAQASELGQAPQNIFTMFNDADLRFPTIKGEEGDDIEVTKGRFVDLLKSKDPRVRKDAFTVVYDTYNKQRNTIASTLGSSVKKDIFFSKVRKYHSALEAALDENQIPTSVYDQLIETVHDHLHLMHRYVSLRKKRLGLDELHMYDLYTPIVKDVDMKVSYEEAKKTIQKGLIPLGDQYLQTLEEGLNGGWIDIYENQGKRSGAYSWGAYGTHPYVLLNYQDNINNMFTLAHEMGHALHSYYSDETQPYPYAQYTIFVAEVASTVNEALLMEHLLKNTTDPKEKMYLMNHFMEQFRGTLYRQTMFAEFEKITHEMVEKGESLTADTLCEIYHDLNVKYYGPDIIVDADIDMEWARIPHFYNAFYVYQYATGYSAAVALSQRILKEGQPAVEDYLTFLKSGNSDYPIQVLKKAGVDMTSSEPIEKALKVFEGLLDEMEKMTE